MLDKRTARRICREKRDALSLSCRKEEAARILTSLRAMPLYRDSRKIFTYYSVGSEVDTRELIRLALGEEKEIYLPVCGENRTMSLYRLRSADDLTEGAYHIPVPACQTRPLEPEKLDLVIVPGLAFDTRGYRLGYGGGYYDRFLARLRPGLAVGFCYASLLTGEVPRDHWDRKCDWLLTGDGVIAL